MVGCKPNMKDKQKVKNGSDAPPLIGEVRASSERKNRICKSLNVGFAVKAGWSETRCLSNLYFPAPSGKEGVSKGNDLNYHVAREIEVILSESMKVIAALSEEKREAIVAGVVERLDNNIKEWVDEIVEDED